MDKDTSRTIEIFRTGRHTAMSGDEIAFSEADLQAAAAAYDPALHEAPLVVGHPKDDDPAYGWVRGLAFDQGSLVASPHQVNEDFAELVNAGAFKKVSASFYTPDSKANPKPGVYYLRHVGFLGAQAPALKGLKQVSFAADEEGVVEFADIASEAGWGLRTVARTFRRLREWMVEQYGREQADTVFEQWELDGLADNAANITAGDRSPAFSENANTETERESAMPDKAAAVTAEQLEAQSRRIDEDRAALARDRAEFAETEARRSAEAFLVPHVAAGRVLPAEQAGLVAFMAQLDGTGTVSFGEAGEKTPAKFFEGFIAALPKRVEFREKSADDGADPADAGDPVAVARDAVAYQEAEKAKGNTVSADAAVRHVLKETSR